MNTKQNAYGKIGPVEIGTPYKVEKGGTFKYPNQRLLEFLDVDANDEKFVELYCERYKFVPRNLSEGLSKGFKEEQSPVREVYENLEKGVLTDDDINRINIELEQIHPKLHIHKNTGQINAKTVYETTIHKNAVVSIWEDLKDYILEKSYIKKCPYCGNPFLRNKIRPQQKYCCDEHRLKARETRKQKNRKQKTEPPGDPLKASQSIR